MKVLLTTHAQMFRSPDGCVWTKSIYGYDFFKRHLAVFEEIRLVTRMKEISEDETKTMLKVDGPGLEFYPMPFYHGPWQYARQILKIRSHFTKAIDGCDCAILRIPDQLSFQMFKRIKQYKLPCAIEVVADPWESFARGTTKTILRPFLRILWDYLQKNICRKANGVTYVTQNYLQKRYPSQIKENDVNRFESFYTSADMDDSYYYRARTIKDYQNESSKLVHVSGINNTAKGHGDLLHAIRLLKDRGTHVNMTFIGGGTMLSYYENLSAELGLKDRVVFLGSVSSIQKIIDTLKESDIFVFPTMTEGLPRVILEAMATGLPCIATDVGGIPELLSKRCLIKPNDTDGLIQKIVSFINDKDLLIQESSRNFKKSKEFSASAISIKRRKFYSQLADMVQK